MKQFFKMFLASLLAIIVSGFILIGMMVGALVNTAKSITEREKRSVSGNILCIDLSAHFPERTMINSLAILGGSDKTYEVGLWDLTRSLDKAKTDPQVKGILLKLSGTPNGWATLQQMRAALADFKSSGKFIYAYGEDIPQAAYYVASVADSIYLNPAGGIELKGFATQLAFFKGTLDKLEVEPEIFFAGKFKSATEPFRADKMSEPNRLQIQAFQGGIWDEFMNGIAAFTHTDKSEINNWVQNGTIQFPADAVKYKMISALLYWDEVEQRIRTKTGMKNDAEVKLIDMETYAENTGADKYSLPKIAILAAEGDIVDGESEKDNEIASQTFCETIRKLAADNTVHAVVLRVNSPGGSAMASEVILRELNLLHKKKPLIVSMGDYAASGGYYISCQADSIFALPTTITGSIGVFSMMFDVDKMLKNKLGVTFDEVKNAPYADVPTPFRSLTPAEGQRMQSYVDTIYALFKGRVSTGRKISPADVDSIAQGRVWTGTDAMKIHLIDGIGGMKRAIASAAAMAKLPDYRTVVYPESEDKLNKIFKKLKKNNAADEAIKAALKGDAGIAAEWMEKLRSMAKMNGKAMMAMPFVPKVQ